MPVCPAFDVVVGWIASDPYRQARFDAVLRAIEWAIEAMAYCRRVAMSYYEDGDTIAANDWRDEGVRWEQLVMRLHDVHTGVCL